MVRLLRPGIFVAGGVAAFSLWQLGLDAWSGWIYHLIVLVLALATAIALAAAELTRTQDAALGALAHWRLALAAVFTLLWLSGIIFDVYQGFQLRPLVASGPETLVTEVGLFIVSAIWCVRELVRLVMIQYRQSRGSCLRCGYDCSGLRAGACPECGAAIPRDFGTGETP